MQKGLFKCSRKKIKKLVKDLCEDTELLKLPKVELVDKIRKLKNQNQKLKEETMVQIIELKKRITILENLAYSKDF